MPNGDSHSTPNFKAQEARINRNIQSALKSLTEQEQEQTPTSDFMKRRIYRFSQRLATKFSTARGDKRTDMLMASTIANQAMTLADDFPQRAKKLLDKARLIYSGS